jgi:hypothetical protein
MPVPTPVISPADPNQPTLRKRPQTISASRIYGTDDPQALQEPTHTRCRVLQAQMNDLWSMWRDLNQGGRRRT